MRNFCSSENLCGLVWTNKKTQVQTIKETEINKCTDKVKKGETVIFCALVGRKVRLTRFD